MKMLPILFSLSFGITAHAIAAGDADQDFVTKASQAGMAEVALGHMASEHGSADSVKQFGQHMVDDHGKANDKLKSIAAKAGQTVASEPSKAQQETAAELKQKKGAEFDMAYAKTMVKDHEQAVALFEKEASSGENSELKAFAKGTLPTLKSHLQMAQQLPSK
jgi:putative membrane protein